MHAPPLRIGHHRDGQFRQFEAHAMHLDDDICIGVIGGVIVTREILENITIHTPITGSRIRDGFPRNDSYDLSEQLDPRRFQ